MLVNRRFTTTILCLGLLLLSSAGCVAAGDGPLYADEGASAGDGNRPAPPPGRRTGQQPTEPTKPLPNSKLGVHVMGGNGSAAVQDFIKVCPRVMKWFEPSLDDLKSFAAQCPGSVIVVRLWPGKTSPYHMSDDPIVCANNYWHRIESRVNSLDPNYVDWLEGPNELDDMDNWFANGGVWYAHFASRLADLMQAKGYRPLLGSIPVGNGEGAFLKPFGDMVKHRNDNPLLTIGWSYHAYSAALSVDVNAEQWTTFRYRRIAQEAQMTGIPIVLSEAGQDSESNGGWKKQFGLTAEGYLNWLKWFDGQIRQDEDVIGATIFQVGDTGQWDRFDLGPLSKNMSAYINASRPK